MKARHALICSLILLLLMGSGRAEVPETASLSNELGNPPGIVDHLLLLESRADWDAGTASRVALGGDDPPGLMLSDDRNSAYPRRGSYTTAEIPSDFPFTEIIPSWNVECPPETGLQFQLRVRDAETAEWSPYVYMGHWGRINHWPERTLRFEWGEVHVDNLRLSRPADSFQLRVSFTSFDLEDIATPRLKKLHFAYSGIVEDPKERARLQQPPHLDGKKWAVSLPIPFHTQVDLDRSISGSTCSPTSVSMLLEFHGIKRPVVQNAMEIYDPEYGIFGNWARATALASQFGLEGYVCRVRTWDRAKEYIAAGQPLIASIRFREGEFPSNPMDSTGGHLIVIRGFTPEGDVIVNDPAIRDRGNGIVYKADELARAWFDKGGVTYVIAAPMTKEAVQ